jgi:hypothetical protein
LATERAIIDSTTATASAAASVSIGGSAAGALTTSQNNLNTRTNASILSSIVNAASGVTVEALDTSNVSAEVVSVALSAGLVSLAVGVVLVDNSIGNDVNAFIDASTVTANGSGDVYVHASSQPTIDAESTVGAVSFGLGGSGAGGSSKVSILGTTQAYIVSSNVTAAGDDIRVLAESQAMASPKIESLSAGLAAVNAMVSEATFSGQTKAWLGGSVTLLANATQVRAVNTSQAKPDTVLAGGGAISFSLATSKVTLVQPTNAYVASGARVQLNAGSLDVLAESNGTAYTNSSSAGGGGIAVSVLDILSTTNNTTRTQIESGASIFVPTTNSTGDITLSATSKNFAVSNTSSNGGGGINIQVSNSKAVDSSTTESLMLGNITGPNGGTSGARNLTVRATANDRALAGAQTAGGGLIQVGVAESNAQVSPKINASLGGNVQVTNNILVVADSRTDADSSNDSAGGGGVSVSVLNANVTVSPTIETLVQPGARILAGNTVTIHAIHGETAPQSPLLVGTTAPPAANGIATSRAGGASGGAIQVASITTELSLAPAVHNVIGSGAKVTGIKGLDLQARSQADANVSASGVGGGLLSVGKSESDLTVYPKAIITIDTNAKLESPGMDPGIQGSINVLAVTRIGAHADADSTGGGLIAVAGADVDANLNYTSSIDIKDSASLITNGALSVNTNSHVNADVVSDVVAGGGIAVGTNNTNLNVGNSATRARTTTAIGTNALLRGTTVTLGAVTTKMDLSNSATESADGLGSGANVNAFTTIKNLAQVSLATDSVVSGDTVQIVSSHAQVDLRSFAEATAFAFIGIPSSNAKVDYDSDATVTAARGSLVSGRTINVNAVQDVQSYSRESFENAWQFAIVNLLTSGSWEQTRRSSSESGQLNAKRTIDWNGDLAIVSAPNPKLFVDSTGKIVEAIGVTVAGKGKDQFVTDPTVSVDPILNTTNNSSSITLTTSPQQTRDGQTSPLGVITGADGTVSVATAFQSVDITNESNKDLVINGIQPVNPNTVPTVRLVAPAPTYTFVVGVAIPPTDITIVNRGANGRVLLNAPNGNVVPGSSDKGFSIYNPVGSTSITSQQSIEHASGSNRVPTIWTRSLELDAGAGIGTSSNRLAVDLVLPFGQTDFNAIAKGDVFLDLEGRLRSASIAQPIFAGSNIQTTGDINILLQPTVREVVPNPNMGAGTVNRVINGNAVAPVTSSARGDARFFPDYSQSSTTAGTFDFDLLRAGDVNGDITITAARPSASDPSVGFRSGSDIGTNGELNVQINGSLDLTEQRGDIRIRNVVSNAGNVSLTAIGDLGSIYDLANEGTVVGTTPWITGNGVSLRSRDGGIGSATDFLEINSSNQTNGGVIALATNGVYLSETAGTIDVDQIMSRIEDVVLTVPSGSILESGSDAQADIQGRNIDLIAIASGSRIGEAGNAIEILGAGVAQRPNDGFQIEPFAPGTGRLVAQANAGVYLTEMSGSLNILDVNTPTGDIELTVHDSVLAVEDLNWLVAGGTTFFGTNVPSGRVIALLGDVRLSAGDNINLLAGTSIQSGNASGNQVVIRAGQLASDAKDPDPVGAILTLEGLITAPNVEVYGGSNLDYFDVINPNGIQSITHLYGLGGDDRFFIQNVPVAMTVDGGSGANLYYVSSNARRDLFVTNGVFNDSGDDLAYAFGTGRLSSGTLEKITASLTLNTGDGGNGGAKDAIYLSAAGSTSALTSGVIALDRVSGIGNTGDIRFTTTTNGGVSLLVKLSPFDDTLQVTGANSQTQAFVFGGAGNDTLNAGVAGDPLSSISGIVGFFGEEGADDTLNVHGIATPPASATDSSNLLTAIAVTGLGSNANKNRLVSTHNDLFGAGYTIQSVSLVNASLDAVQLTMTRIQDLSGKLQKPTRPIDQYVADSLATVTEKSLYGLSAGDQIVFRVNNGGSSPIVGLKPNQAYFVQSISATEVRLSQKQSDSSNVVVPRSMVGVDSNQVTLALVDSENFVTLDATPTLGNNRLTYAKPHGLTTGQPVVYRPGSGNARIGGLVDGNVYYAIRIDDLTIAIAATADDAKATTPIPIGLAGPATDVLVNDIQSTFNAFSNVSSSTIAFTSPHAFTTGQSVVYRSGNVTPAGVAEPVGGLVDGAVYFVIRTSDTAIQLAATASDATSTPAVPLAINPLSASTSKLDSITVRRSFNQAPEVFATFSASANVASNTIQFSGNHGFANGQAVVYQPGNATSVTGLNAGQVYYVIRTSDTALQLALTLSNATSNPPVATSITALTSATNLDTLTSRRTSSQAFIEPGRIVFGSDPGFFEGQAVVYHAGNSSSSIGLVDGQVYFVKRVPGNTQSIELAVTRGGDRVSIVPAAGNSLDVDSLAPASVFAPASVKNDSNEIVFASEHGWVNGQRLTYSLGAGNGSMFGLTSGNSYFAEVTSPTSIKLRATASGSILDINSRTTISLLPVVSETAAELLAKDLNRLIQGPSLYDSQRFAGIALRPETLQLLSQFPQGNPVVNRLLLEDAYPEALPRIASLTPELPASIYYAQRFINRAGAESILSTVEKVNIRLSGSGNELNVDSTFGGKTTVEGGTNTTVTVGSTLDGLHPAQNRRVSFIDGDLRINAANITLDDSGNDRSTVGTLESDRVTGLGMPGAIQFVGTPSVTIKLGANDDTFYVPGTASGQTVTLESGGGFDTTYIGTRSGSESTGSLAGLLGTLKIDGGSVLSGLNTLFLNDQSTTTPQSFIVDNDYNWTVSGNTSDKTTLTRSGVPIVQFTRQEIVALNGGSGGNTIDVRQTHREQSTDGSASSTFTINAGAGSDVITLGKTIGSTGTRSMEGFQQEIGAPSFTGANPSPRGIPVLLNGQGGTDVVNVDDSASIRSSNLGLTQKSFRELFPEAPDANTDSVDVYRVVFGDDPLARSLTTVAMAYDAARPINIYLRQTLAQSNRTANENMTLSMVLGSAADIVQMVSAPYEIDIAIATGDGKDTINVENGVRFLNGHTLQFNAGGDDDATYVDFNGISVIDRGGIGQTVSKVAYVRDSADAGKVGYSPLTPGQYFVETRWNVSDWQFRVVDPNGLAIAVADLDTPDGLIANWQSIRRLPIVGQPDAQNGLVYRFDSHRGLILEFSAAYAPTGDSIVGAMALDLIPNGFKEVVGVTIDKFGALHRTVSSVNFLASDVDAAHRLKATSDYFIQTRWDALNSLWQFRLWNNTSNRTVEIRSVSSAGPNFTDDWQNIASVAGNAAGRRVYASGTGLIIEFANEFEAGSLTSSDAMELLLGVPASQLSFTLDGGSQSANGVGDTLRISGDGKAIGAKYIPSSTLPGGGVFTVAGNTFNFRGIEPLIVHGLPDFEMVTPDQAAALVIDSETLADTVKQQLQLHTLTVEGQVTWTQRRQFDIDRAVMDPRSLGRTIAVSDDGLTMVVGAKATPIGSATAGELTDGINRRAAYPAQEHGVPTLLCDPQE